MENGQREVALRGGRIVLYTRADDRHGFWNVRLRLGNDRKLVRRSTRTTNIDEAKHTAEELYDELRYKHQNQKSLSAVIFKKVAADFLRKTERETIEGRLSKGRRDLIAGTVERYLNPFFGKFDISDLSTAHFGEYDDWRLDYWTVGYGSSRQAYHTAPIPSQKTLVIEQGILRQILKHAVGQGWLDNLPYMKPKSAKTNRRSAFAIHEYRVLRSVMRRRVVKATHPRIRHDRRLLELYLQLMVGTGMRIGEARHLRWSDVEFITVGNNGSTQEAVRIWVDGKTGKRALIGTAAAKITVKKLLSFYGYQNIAEARDGGEYLFRKTNGDLVKTFEVGFRNLLIEAGLETDRYKKNRTLYCLRHSYAVYRLLFGNVNVYLLAKNMGTSVAMVEAHYGFVSPTLAADKLL